MLQSIKMKSKIQTPIWIRVLYPLLILINLPGMIKGFWWSWFIAVFVLLSWIFIENIYRK